MRPSRTKLKKRPTKTVEICIGAVSKIAKVPIRNTLPRSLPEPVSSWRTKEEAEERRTSLRVESERLLGLLKLEEVIGEDGNVLKGYEKAAWTLDRKMKLSQVQKELSAIRKFIRGLPLEPKENCLLLARCYRLLVALDERGVELGKEGETLLSDIEDSVSIDLLLGEESS